MNLKNDFEILKLAFPDEMSFLIERIASLYENLNCIDVYYRQVKNTKEEDLFTRLENDCPIDGETEWTKKMKQIT